MTLPVVCPLCRWIPIAGPAHIAQHDVGGTRVTNQTWVCSSCGLVFAASEPDLDWASLYGEAWHTLPQGAEHVERVKDNADWLEHYARLLRGDRSVFDVGCGRGHLLDALAKRGWRTAGCEPDPEACRDAAARHEVTKLPLEECAFRVDRPHGALTLIHVLEHSPDPLHLLRSAKDFIAVGGILYATTPDLEVMDQLDTAGEPIDIRHRVFFSSATLKAALLLAGYEILEIMRDRLQLRVTARPGSGAAARARDSLARARAVVNDRRREIQARLEDLRGRPLALYGAGAHADDLMRYVIPDAAHWVSRVADGNKSLWGEEFWNRRIESPAEFQADPPPVIVIASKAYQEEIHAELTGYPELAETTIVKLYERGGLTR